MPTFSKGRTIMLSKLRIALAAIIMALATVSAVGRASAATAIEYGLISALVLQVPEQEVTSDGRMVSGRP
jgi:hypothetical protein